MATVEELRGLVVTEVAMLLKGMGSNYDEAMNDFVPRVDSLIAAARAEGHHDGFHEGYREGRALP